MAGAAPAEPSAVATLLSGQSVDVEIRQDDEHGGEARVAIEAPAKSLLHLEVEQLDVDVAVRLEGTGGKVLWQSQAVEYAGGREPVWAIHDGGRLSLIVEIVDPQATDGKIRVEWVESREPTASDARRVAGERELAKAQELRRRGTRAEMLEALDRVMRARMLFAELELPGRQGSALRLEMQVLRRLNRHGEAHERAAAAIELARRSGDRRAESAALLDRSVISWAEGDYESALSSARSSHAVAQSIDDERRIFEAQKNISLFLGLLGRLREALEMSRHLEERSRGTGDLKDLAFELNNQGTVLHRLGDNLAALEAWKEAEELLTRLELNRQAAAVLSNIGSMHVTLGDTDGARPFLARSLALRKELGDLEGQASSQASLAAADLVDRAYGPAASGFGRAAQLYGRAKNRWGEIHCRAERGVALHRAGSMEAAREVLTATLQDARAAGYRRLEATASLGLGRIAEPEQARAHLHRALELSEALEAPYRRAEVLYELARMLAAAGERDKALQAIQDAVDTAESVRSRAGTDSLKAAYLAEARAFYDLWIELLLDGEGERDRAAAFRVAERARARSLLDHLALSRTPARARLDSALIDREIEADDRVASLGQQLARAASRGEVDLEEVRRELRGAIEAQKQIRAEIRRDSPSYAGLIYPEPLDTTDIRAELRSGETLLFFHVGEEKSYRFLLDHQKLEVEPLPGREALERRVKSMRALLSSDRRRVEARLERHGVDLFEVLLREEWPYLSSRRRLVVVPGGPLAGLPFEVLITDGVGAKHETSVSEGSAPRPFHALPFLIRTHQVDYALSGTLLAQSRRAEKVAKPGERRLELAAFAASVEEEGTFRSGEVHAKSGSPPAESRRKRRAEGRFSGLGPLRASRQEATFIASLFPERAVLLTGESAEKDRLRGPEISTARYLHFATHALVDPVFSARSALVLSPTQGHGLEGQSGEISDGLLTAEEIVTLELQAELVTLAACETVLGKNRPGEGLMGLARAFFFSGTERLVASLWAVSDQASAELMKDLYRRLADGEGEPGEALRQAKLAMLERPDRRLPFYWAPFILIGG